MRVADYAEQAVQLCKPSKDFAATPELALEKLEHDGYYFEAKLDGVRALILIDGGVRIINRRGSDITARYPDVVAALSVAYEGVRVVFDGELICKHADGMPDFAGIHLRDAQSRAVPHIIAAHPAYFIAFDILFFEGSDLRKMPWLGRNKMLKAQAIGHSIYVDWSFASPDSQSMWEFVKHHGLEGLVAKRPNAGYQGGRNASWVKIKQAFHISCIVVGYSQGKGRREDTFGSLNLALLNVTDQTAIIPFGEVGTGMTDRDLDLLKARCDSGVPFVVDIEVAAVTRETKPRFPSYRGIREDIEVLDCTTEQLAGVPVI